MLRRLFGFLMLLAIVGVVAYLWKVRPAGSPTLGAAARELGGQARGLGAEARDKLGVVGQDLQDTKITASVKTALGLNRSLRSFPIEVSTENGVVTLRGRVDGEAVRARAEAVAAEVPDVIKVTNQLQGGAGSAPAGPAAGRTVGESLDDHTLEMQVRLALSLNRGLKGSDLTVQVYRREVTLGGEAASPAQRDLALQTARDTAAVGSVTDQIHVRGTPDAGTGVASASTSNQDRLLGAQRALESNPNVTAYRLQVREEGGRLVLHGRVRTPAEKDLAGLLARQGAVGPVENAVEVHPGAP